MKHISLLKEYLLITELSQQRYTRAYAGMTQTAQTTHYDWSSHNNIDISNKYMVTVRNKFNTLLKISETLILNDEYENFINAHMEAAAECIPTKPRPKCRVPWETLTVRKKRDNMQTASLCNKRNQTNANAQKLKNAQRDLTHTKKNKFKVRSIK